MASESPIWRRAFQPDPFAFTCFFPPNISPYQESPDEIPFFFDYGIETGSGSDFSSLTAPDTDDDSSEESTRNVIGLFESIACAYPTTIAIDAECFQITYSELHASSSNLASCIAPYVVPGQPVPLLTSLSESAIIGILAILKAGGTYVPVDCSQWPEEHTTCVLNAIGGRVLVYSTEYAGFAKTRPGYPIAIPVHRRGHERNENYDSDSASSLDEDFVYDIRSRGERDLACVIFTSGTTGKPKGVMIRHEALANFVISRRTNMRPTPGARSLLVLSISFDGAFPKPLFFENNC
jgi:non-ribosomal peptide synthetase component F